MKQNKTHHPHHYPPKTIIPFILVFLLGLFVVSSIPGFGSNRSQGI